MNIIKPGTSVKLKNMHIGFNKEAADDFEGIDIDKALKLVRKLQRCEDISGETWLLMTLNKEASDENMV